MNFSYFEKWFYKAGISKFISLKTFKNLSALFSGTFISTIIPIAFSPVISRIYTTSDYGVLGLYISINGLIGVLAYVHYPQAIMLSKKDEDALQALWLSIVFCFVIALLSLGVIIYLNITDAFSSALSLKNWLFFIPLSVFLNGLSTSLMTWANRHQLYKILASNRILQAVLTLILQITIGLVKKDETGLVVGLIAGQFFSFFLLWMRVKNISNAPLHKPDFLAIKHVAISHKKLLFYSTPSEFINNLINQTPIFLLQKFGGMSYVGNYNFTQRLLGIPQQFLSSAIVEVFRQKANVAYNAQGNCKDIFLKTFKALGLLAILPFTLIILFSPAVFSFVFGSEWRMAGEFAQFLGILFFLRFIISPLTYVYIIAGKLKEDFWLHILFLIVTTVSFYIGNEVFTNKKYLILLYSLAYSGVYIIYFFRSFQFSKGRPHIYEK